MREALRSIPKFVEIWDRNKHQWIALPRTDYENSRSTRNMSNPVTLGFGPFICFPDYDVKENKYNWQITIDPRSSSDELKRVDWTAYAPFPAPLQHATVSEEFLANEISRMMKIIPDSWVEINLSFFLERNQLPDLQQAIFRLSDTVEFPLIAPHLTIRWPEFLGIKPFNGRWLANNEEWRGRIWGNYLDLHLVFPARNTRLRDAVQEGISWREIRGTGRFIAPQLKHKPQSSLVLTRNSPSLSPKKLSRLPSEFKFSNDLQMPTTREHKEPLSYSTGMSHRQRSESSYPTRTPQTQRSPTRSESSSYSTGDAYDIAEPREPLGPGVRTLDWNPPLPRSPRPSMQSVWDAAGFGQSEFKFRGEPSSSSSLSTGQGWSF